MQSIYEIRRIRLRELINEVWGGSTANLTKAMKWETPSFASRLISESPGNQKNIGNQMARDIEKAAGKPRFTLDTPPWADETAMSASMVREPVVRFARAPQPQGARLIPVIGFAIATPDEDGYFDDMGFPPGAGEVYISWPTRDPNAYALRVKNDSMAPRIRAEEFVVVEPGTTPSPGDDVIVKTKNGRKMVKQLLFQRAGTVTFGSINQAYKPVTISLEDVESIEFVGGVARHSVER